MTTARRITLSSLPLLSLLVGGCYSTGDLGDVPFLCTADYPECPDGYTCDLTVCSGTAKCNCVRGDSTTSQLSIPKTGSYSGQHVDPMLSTCKENDDDHGFSTAISVGDSSGYYGNSDTTSDTGVLEICPAGDVDVFSININPNEYAMVMIHYFINRGDLDLAVFDGQGKQVKGAIDADATHDGACVTLPGSTSTGTVGQPLPAGNYFAVVSGAGNTAVNRYNFMLCKSATPFTCTNPLPGIPNCVSVTPPANPDMSGP